ncbi:hypothetical protein Tco_0256514 [Tanacetum coccineum]
MNPWHLGLMTPENIAYNVNKIVGEFIRKRISKKRTKNQAKTNKTEHGMEEREKDKGNSRAKIELRLPSQQKHNKYKGLKTDAYLKKEEDRDIDHLGVV